MTNIEDLKDGVKLRVTQLISETTKVKLGDIITFKNWWMGDSVDEFPIFESYEITDYVFYTNNVKLI